MRQWIRDLKLVIGLSQTSTEALDFSEFRVRFEIKQAMVDTPASAEIYIYNVSENTRKKFIGLGQTIILEAGYQGGRGIIFKGTVRQLFIGRENQTDTYLCVLGQSSDVSRNYAVTNGTLAAGYSHYDVINTVRNDMVAKGDLEEITFPQLTQYKMPRGRAMFGMSRDYISEIGATHNLQIGYVDNKIFAYEQDPQVDQELAVALNSETGMVGLPQLTISGVYVTCLLRPDIKMGTQIYINESSVQRQILSVAYAAEGTNIQLDDSHIAQDGYYRAEAVSHYGDTRANDWYSQICCVGINATAPITGPTINAV